MKHKEAKLQKTQVEFINMIHEQNISTKKIQERQNGDRGIKSIKEED